MVALPAATTYINPGTTVVMSLPAVADVDNPTNTEITAGTDLTAAVKAVSDGWTVAAADVDSSGLDSVWKRHTSGMLDNSGALSITFDASTDGEDIRTILPRGTDTFIAIFHGGNTAGNLMDIWPVNVNSLSKPIDVGGTTQARIVVDFTRTGVPGIDVTIPAAA